MVWPDCQTGPFTTFAAERTIRGRRCQDEMLVLCGARPDDPALPYEGGVGARLRGADDLQLAAGPTARGNQGDWDTRRTRNRVAHGLCGRHAHSDQFG